MNTGVYAIRCRANGKVYIGSTTLSFVQRWNSHRSQLDHGRHANRYLQAAWDRHGADAFEFMAVEVCDPGMCIQREQSWIDRLQAADRIFGYNIRTRAENNLGLKYSEESRRRLSEAVKGRKASVETRAKLSAIAKARGIPPEVSALAHAARRGKPISDEQKAKQSASLTGRKHDPVRVAKVAAALRGYRHGPDVCARMSAGQKGKKHSEATKAKMSATRTGRKHSDAHCKAISEGLKDGVRHSRKSNTFAFMEE